MDSTTPPHTQVEVQPCSPSLTAASSSSTRASSSPTTVAIPNSNSSPFSSSCSLETLSMMMNAHQLQQMQQLSQLAAHPSLVAQVQQQVAAAQQQQQQQQQVSHPSHGAADSDDSSGEEHYDLDDQLHKQAGKPWVPSIEDPNYFEDLSPEEIYDSFFSIRRMGFIANRIIRKLNETKHIVSSKILEKRKKLKAVQRKQFEQLSPAGVEYLKVLLKMGKSLLFSLIDTMN